MSFFAKFCKWWHSEDSNGQPEILLTSKWYKKDAETGKITMTSDLTIDPPDSTGWQRSPMRHDSTFVKNPLWTGDKK